MLTKNCSFLLLALVFMACESVTKKEVTTLAYDQPAHHIQEITQVFDAHGGYAQWRQLKSLKYQQGGTETTVNLQNRKTRLNSDNQKVGFDGKNVWVYPPTENAERQRMRYNLMFYFYAFPFVVGDPGVNYEALEPLNLQDETYDAVKISYGEGVGDSPKDNYIILSDQQSHEMQWLLYTATFGGDEAKDQYSLIKYNGWQKREGVLLPSSLQWYEYDGEEVGEPRGEPRVFEEVMLSLTAPNDSIFTAPKEAYIIKN